MVDLPVDFRELLEELARGALRRSSSADTRSHFTDDRAPPRTSIHPPLRRAGERRASRGHAEDDEIAFLGQPPLRTRGISSACEAPGSRRTTLARIRSQAV